MVNLKYSLLIHHKYWRQFLFEKQTFPIEIRGTKFYIRPRTTDLLILAEIFEEKCYQPTFMLKKKFNLIVDLGAHMGSFSIWANKIFQPQKIISIEMEQDNFKMLQKNIAVNKLSNKIKLINKAIYSQNKFMKYKKTLFDKGRQHLVITPNNKSQSVKTINLVSLIKENQIKKIDFLKIDIEGAEKYLLTEKNKDIFKHKVDFLMMEVHSVPYFNKTFTKVYLEKLGFSTKITIHLCGFFVEAIKTG